MNKVLFVVVMLIVHFGVASAEYPFELKEDEAEKICAGYKNYAPDPEAVPTDEDRRRFGNEKVCGYFIEESIGNLQELAEIRSCCLVTGSCNRDLAMIFANGWGTRRDYDSAMHFLCRAGGEMAAFEQWEMIAHIQGMMKDKSPQDLLYCGYVTSGEGRLYCAQVKEDQKETVREGKIEELRKTLDKIAQQKLDDLIKAAEEFASNEGALAAVPWYGGRTWYPAEALTAKGEVYDGAVSAIVRLSGKRASSANAGRLKKADADLNKTYKWARANAPECDLCSDPKTVGINALRDSQRAWIKYRDAWIVFYQARWKDTATLDALEREITTELTIERTKQLRKIRDERD